MPNKELDNFLKYLQNERQASVHTTESYRMDIEQFAKMILKKDIVDNPDSANWASVNVFSTRMFVLELQKEELTVFVLCAIFTLIITMIMSIIKIVKS